MSRESLQRFSFLGTALAVAVITVLSVLLEYRSAGDSSIAGALVFPAVLGMAVTLFLAFREFRNLRARDILLAAVALGILPQIAGWFLESNGTKLNIHGISILAFFSLLFGCWLCAAGLLLGLAVRVIVQRPH